MTAETLDQAISRANALKAELDALQERDRKRSAEMAKARHDVGNALSIAQASIEGMLDGIVPITDPRLNRLRQILAGVSDAMYRLTGEDEEEIASAPTE